MKRHIILLISLISIVVSVAPLSFGITVSPSGSRLWDLAEENLSLGDVIESKVCVLDLMVEGSFSDTFTMLDFLLDKVCTIDSKIDVIDNELDTTNSLLVTLGSKIDVIGSDFDTTINILDVIRVNDFGGTWTALDELQSKLCSKFDLTFSDLDVIESKLDVLSGTQESHFVDTFTTLQVVADNVLETTVQLESLSEQLMTDLSTIDQCVLTAKDIMETVDSKLDLIDTDFEINFAGTFTAIDALQQKACTIESKLDLLEVVIQINQSATFTALADVKAKLCTVDSKVGVIDVNLSEIDSFVDDILLNMQSSNSKACVLDSKLDLLNDKLVTTDSKVDVISIKATAIEDDIDDINTVFTSITAKACTIDSRVDVIDHIRITVESKIDVLNIDLVELDSKVDALSIEILVSKVCTLDSRIDVLDSAVQTVVSNVDLIDNSRITIESTIDSIDTTLSTILSKICTIDSKVDVVDSGLVAISERLITVDSKVDVIGSNLDVICINVATLDSILITSDSKIEVIDNNIQTVLSKVCTIDSHIDAIDSKIELLSVDIGTGDAEAISLIVDMQNTWTILVAIESKACLAEEQAVVIDDKLIASEVFDFSAVFTAIESIEQKACDALEGAFTLESKIDAFNMNCITDLGPTFTALNEVEDQLCSVDSKVDVLITDIQNIVDLNDSVIGTPLAPADFLDTFSITEPGRYFLVDDIDFNSVSKIAIYIDADDVHIDMCDRTIRQATVNTGISAIKIADGKCNVSIANGKIRDFTDRGIELLGNNNFIRLLNIVLIENGANQLLINSSFIDEGTSNIIVKNVTVGSTGLNCIDCNNASGIFIVNTMALGATNSVGIHINACDYICLRDSTANDNNEGIVGGATNNGDNQRFGMTNFVIDSCKTLDNNSVGIVILGFNKNGVITNSIAQENQIGFSFEQQSNQIQDSTTICVVNNVSSNNTLSGIRINSNASNNYLAFNQMWENGSTNFLEDGGEGPNSVLGNFAFKSSGTNYSGGNTTINTVSLQEDASFPAPEPKYWVNASMLPT